MSVNNYKPHVLVLPEDDANSAIANGFYLEVNHSRKMQILPPAGGWVNSRDAVLTQHEKGLPNDLKDRVCGLGARTEPEKLRQAKLGTFEEIGRKLAVECREGKGLLAAHELLTHNPAELARLKATIFSILF